MEIVYIKDSEYVFGFIKEMSAICSQGKTKKEVRKNIVDYFKKINNVSNKEID
jgi:predicted RNase H-like HicB family nuclease